MNQARPFLYKRGFVSDVTLQNAQCHKIVFLYRKQMPGSRLCNSFVYNPSLVLKLNLISKAIVAEHI